MIDELGDWEGGFLALTGLTQNDEPELVGVAHGQEPELLPLLAFRMFLLESGQIDCIAKVEGVSIFQIGEAEKQQQPLIAKICAARRSTRSLCSSARRENPRCIRLHCRETHPSKNRRRKPESGVFVSLLPGAVAFGTTPDALSEAIRRYKHKLASPSRRHRPPSAPLPRGIAGPDCSPGAIPPASVSSSTTPLACEFRRHQDEIEQSRPLARSATLPSCVKLLQQAEVEHRRDTREWTFLQKNGQPCRHARNVVCGLLWSLEKRPIDLLRRGTHERQAIKSPSICSSISRSTLICCKPCPETLSACSRCR